MLHDLNAFQLLKKRLVAGRFSVINGRTLSFNLLSDVNLLLTAVEEAIQARMPKDSVALVEPDMSEYNGDEKPITERPLTSEEIDQIKAHLDEKKVWDKPQSFEVAKRGRKPRAK